MCFYGPLYFTGDLRWRYLSLREERYRRKTRQRAPKPPFGNWLFNTGVWRGDVRASYEFAVMQLTRFRPVRGVLRTASTDSCVLHALRRKRLHLRNNQPNLWSEVGWLRKCFPFNRTRSTQRQGDKRSAAADLIASHAPLRGGRHTARQNGPKHYPRGFKGPQPLGTPFSSIFRRAAKDGVPEGPAEKRMPVNT